MTQNIILGAAAATTIALLGTGITRSNRQAECQPFLEKLDVIEQTRLEIFKQWESDCAFVSMPIEEKIEQGIPGGYPGDTKEKCTDLYLKSLDNMLSYKNATSLIPHYCEWI